MQFTHGVIISKPFSSAHAQTSYPRFLSHKNCSLDTDRALQWGLSERLVRTTYHPLRRRTVPTLFVEIWLRLLRSCFVCWLPCALAAHWMVSLHRAHNICPCMQRREVRCHEQTAKCVVCAWDCPSWICVAPIYTSLLSAHVTILREKVEARSACSSKSCSCWRYCSHTSLVVRRCR